MLDARALKPLLSALDAGYRYRPPEMLRYFLSGIRTLWGLPEWDKVPADIQPVIGDAIEAYGGLVAKHPPFVDILGPVYMELASHGARQMLGQFFTPWPIASMMAQITLGDPPDPKGRLCYACDPACGSAVMMLAFANAALEQWGPEMLKRISVTCADLDYYCAHMAATQFVANCNVHQLQVGEILVLRGNSLMPWESMDVILHATAPGEPAPSAKAFGRLKALAEAAQAHPDIVSP